MVGIGGDLSLKQRAGDGQQTVAHGAQGPAMAMATATQLGVATTRTPSPARQRTETELLIVFQAHRCARGAHRVDLLFQADQFNLAGD